MVWWIWVILIIYLCVGSYLTGVYVAGEELDLVQGILSACLIVPFWFIVLILHIVIRCIEDTKICNNFFEWKDNWKNRKKYKKEDKEFEDGEEELRLQRMGMESRDDIWDSRYNT